MHHLISGTDFLIHFASDDDYDADYDAAYDDNYDYDDDCDY